MSENIIVKFSDNFQFIETKMDVIIRVGNIDQKNLCQNEKWISVKKNCKLCNFDGNSFYKTIFNQNEKEFQSKVLVEIFDGNSFFKTNFCHFFFWLELSFAFDCNFFFGLGLVSITKHSQGTGKIPGTNRSTQIDHITIIANHVHRASFVGGGAGEQRTPLSLIFFIYDFLSKNYFP